MNNQKKYCTFCKELLYKKHGSNCILFLKYVISDKTYFCWLKQEGLAELTSTYINEQLKTKNKQVELLDRLDQNIEKVVNIFKFTEKIPIASFLEEYSN
jgi:predicted amidophosphoribosyltransferase